MLSDPIAVTYDSSAKTMPRATGVSPSVRKVLGTSYYKTADGELTAKTVSSLLSDQSNQTEIILTRFDAVQGTSNSFGFVIRTNHMDENPGDLAKLRAALDSFVTPTLLARLAGGEI